MHDFTMEILANYNLFVQRGKSYIKGYLKVLDRKIGILIYKLQRNAIAVTLTLRCFLLCYSYRPRHLGCLVISVASWDRQTGV